MGRGIVWVVVFGVSVMRAFGADDLAPPSWRGQVGSTYQLWTFDDADNPAAPVGLENATGTAEAMITVSAIGAGWLFNLGGMGTQTGWWDLGGEGGGMVFEITDSGGPYVDKEVWVQVTYYEDWSQAPAVAVSGASFLSEQTLLVEDAGDGALWRLHQSRWRMAPSEGAVSVVLTADAAWGTVVDEVVVDTLSGEAVCLVDEGDLAALSAAWLSEGSGLGADLNGDEVVNLKDYAILASLWLEPCPVDWPLP